MVLALCTLTQYIHTINIKKYSATKAVHERCVHKGRLLSSTKTKDSVSVSRLAKTLFPLPHQDDM